MARTVHIIGIGMGSVAHLTQQAIAKLRACDVFLVPDKGEAKDDLVRLREQVCQEVCEPGSYRFVTVPDPRRTTDNEPEQQVYLDGVDTWRNARAQANAAMMETLAEDDVVGFLAWGDPAFFDSTIRMVHEIGEHLDLDVDVTPGLAAFQILAAEAGVHLNDISKPVHITPGRRLVEDYRPELGTVVVMLDGSLQVRELAPAYPHSQLVWGAYLGLPQQRIVAGPLADVIDDIVQLRAELRAEYGWLMDTYALWPSAGA